MILIGRQFAGIPLQKPLSQFRLKAIAIRKAVSVQFLNRSSGDPKKEAPGGEGETRELAKRLHG